MIVLNGVVRACHDLSEGGLAVAAAEMCLSGRLGLLMELPQGRDALTQLFGETAGCLLVEVNAARVDEWLEKMAGFPVCQIGRVTMQPSFVVSCAGQKLISLSVQEIAASWRTPLV